MTYEEVNALFVYDPETGVLAYRNTGKEAGTIGGHGYRRVSVSGANTSSHRVMWLLHTGSLPFDMVDHIDGDKLNNKISNLRAVSRQDNGKNARRSKANKSGVTGVTWHKVADKWQAGVTHDGVRTQLGVYADWFEAVCARKSAEARLGFHVNHGRIAWQNG
jgi:hypothetical protein